jgi:hypothetical protein
MFHASGIIIGLLIESIVFKTLKPAVRINFIKKRKAGLTSGLSGDKVYTPSPRRSEGQRGQLGGRCPSHRCEQNPFPTLNGQRNHFIHNLRRKWHYKGSKKICVPG